MKKILLPVSLIAMIAISCGSNDTTTTAKKENETKVDSGMLTKATEVDQKFAVDAANAGMAEVKAGELAKTQGMSQQVKDFGAMMVEDHTKANNELMDIATKKSITLPTEPDSSHQKMYRDLASMKGKDFDKDYVNDMVDGHEKVEKMMQDEIKDGKDPDLVAFATKTLPVVQAHLAKVKAMKDAMK